MSREAYYHKQYLYRLSFPNGMVYIGTTYSIEDRWKNNGAGYRKQRVYEYIQKYGWENIKHEVLLFLPHLKEQPFLNTDKIRKMERELIRAYGDRAINRTCNEAWHKALTARDIEQGRYEKSVFWEIDGVVKPATEWCDEYNASYGRTKRIMDSYEISPKQALTLPPVAPGMNRRAVEYWESLGFHYFCSNKETSCRA